MVRSISLTRAASATDEAVGQCTQAGGGGGGERRQFGDARLGGQRQQPFDFDLHPRPDNGKILDNGDVRVLDVKVGDKVLFGKYAGTEVKVEGEELLVMKEDDIMAVIEG